ncbi:hypothetical protein [Nocardia crassostreae]|uniref:hypothetical protein n=1 Tax=Nocardia crassostreae TaxID=53428 RepID=UPI00082F3315|nr:hypothetical protein [Nocardia crassostreae]
MRIWAKLVILAVWLPIAIAAGPIISARESDLGNIVGGAVWLSPVFLTIWVWSGASGLRNGKALLAGGLISLLLIITVSGHVEAAYREIFTEPREVKVVETVCHKVKGVCTDRTALSTLAGERLPHMLDRGGFEPGEIIVVRWDRTGWATPTLAAEPDPPTGPVWLAALAVLAYAACTVYFVRTARRPKSPDPDLRG